MPQIHFKDGFALMDTTSLSSWYRLVLEYKKVNLKVDSLKEEVILRDAFMDMMSDSISILTNQSIECTEMFKALEIECLDNNECFKKEIKKLHIQRTVLSSACGVLVLILLL